jgi:fermentation-respiration switch protein FrsA (DUF1100 family)
VGATVVTVLLAACALGGLAWLAAALFMVVRQRSYLYRPDRSRVRPRDCGLADMAEIALETDDGLTLAAWYKPAVPPGPGAETPPTVLYFHGNGGNRGWLADKARPLLDAGYGLLLPDYRGYGGNPGTPSEAGLRLDALAARRALLDRGVAAERIVYYGDSLGSGLAVWLATRHAPLALVLEAAFTSIVDVARRRYRWLPVRLMTRDRYTSVRKIAEVTAPLLSLHGDRDALVPVLQGRLVHKAHGGPHKKMVVFSQGGHADLADHGAGGVVVAWLAALSAPAAGGSPPDS